MVPRQMKLTPPPRCKVCVLSDESCGACRLMCMYVWHRVPGGVERVHSRTSLKGHRC